jgi:hypothetical protein
VRITSSLQPTLSPDCGASQRPADVAPFASLRQRRCSSSLRSRGRTRRRRAYAPNATSPVKWRFRWSSKASVAAPRHARSLCHKDGAGNASPTVWWWCRIVGGWAHRKDGEIAFELLEDAGADARAAVERAAEELAARLGEVRLTPRTRAASQVERRLLA